MDVAIKKVRNGIDRIFDKTLQDLVRGVRNNKGREKEFINEAIDEIRVELKHPQLYVKAVAISKLCFLQMLGYEMNWAAFHIVEIMASTKLSEKRLGYWAASQCFDEGTDVLMLTTNLIKKDILKGSEWESGLALGGLACFMTPDLAQDLTDDIISLMSSTRPYVRKRAVLVSYKLFLHYPEALRIALPRLREKLEDKEPGVQAAAVNVICELARKNPKQYLPLSPVLLKLMNKSSNNWVLIKIIKLFGSLIQFEPRLGKKLEEPLKNLINTTSAMSLLYECINTLIQAKSYQPETENTNLIQLCVDKLRILIEDNDQNLKYLGLLSMIKILDTHPVAVLQHKDIILKCLDDKDESIRLRSLDLISKMVSKASLMEIAQKLLEHSKKTENMIYRNELVLKMIQMCSQNNYANIVNFEWYLNILLDLAKLHGKSTFGDVLAFQILDVTVRVKSIRQYSVEQMQIILLNIEQLIQIFTKNGALSVLKSAAWICGEFSNNLNNPVELFKLMLDDNQGLNDDILAVFLQNGLKIFATGVRTFENKSANVEFYDRAIGIYKGYLSHANVEVQERANIGLQCILQMKDIILTKPESDFQFLFEGELKPVGAKAQKKVPLPAELNLDEPINELSDEEEIINQTDSDGEIDDLVHEFKKNNPDSSSDGNEGATQKDSKTGKTISKLRISGDINYLKDTNSPTTPTKSESIDDYQTILSPQENDKDAVNVFEVLGGSQKDFEKAQKSKKPKKKKKSKKSRTQPEPEPIIEAIPHVDIEIMEEEMPEGAQATESDDDGAGDDEAKRLNIDLSDVWSTKKAEKAPKEISKTKKRKKKSKKQTEQNNLSSDEDQNVPPPSLSTPQSEKEIKPVEKKSISNFVDLAANIDLDIKLKRINFISEENGVKFKLRLQNKHKSRTIQDLALSKTENMISSPIPNLSNGAILEVDFMVPSNDISTIEFVSPKLSGVLSYKVESKSKDMKSKKIKFFKNISFFDFMGEWSVKDDQLVDLLHTQFFTVSAEQEYELANEKTMNELVDVFNGCFCVQLSSNGASICGQAGPEGPDGLKFVMLLKLRPNLKSVYATLKCQDDQQSKIILEQVLTLLV